VEGPGADRLMKIAIVKPDYGFQGGFELNLRRIAEGLEARGHRVDTLGVPVADLPRRAFGLDVPDDVHAAGGEFFRYAAMLEAFARVDASGYDVALTTQPPSYAVGHPRKLALFYHHHRIYYDLSEVYLRAGFAAPHEHLVAQRAVHRLDAAHLPSVGWFLAGSENVRSRLERYNGITANVSVVHVPSPQPLDDIAASPGTGTHVLCVSRHEFPKRTELFVHAMKHAADLQGVCVGKGGRLGWVQALDRRFTDEPEAAARARAEDLWLAAHEYVPEAAAQHPGSNVRFLGWVEEADLLRLYRDALCVVAPAFDEDYGHTTLEAMRFGKPLVVCADGGGLPEMVTDGVNGLVVEPDGAAIAEAVRRLAADPDLAARLGSRGAEIAAGYTWERAIDGFADGLARVAA
jgi:glycosyltransferase involved in cell wall biosynthesis